MAETIDFLAIFACGLILGWLIGHFSTKIYNEYSLMQDPEDKNTHVRK